MTVPEAAVLGPREAPDVELPTAQTEGGRREGIRPPKFADKFAEIDFEAEPMPAISMFAPPPVRELACVQMDLRGEDLKLRTMSFEDLRRLPVHEIAADLVCQIFNWHENVTWKGFLVSDVLEACRFEVNRAGYLVFRSADGHYFETLSVDDAHDARVMLAFGMNGGPLPHRFGGPLRLVVPFLQGYKSVKWVDRIEAYPRDPVGIKRLLGQSKTGRLGQAWLDKLAITPPTGRPSDP